MNLMQSAKWFKAPEDKGMGVTECRVCGTIIPLSPEGISEHVEEHVKEGVKLPPNGQEWAILPKAVIICDSENCKYLMHQYCTIGNVEIHCDEYGKPKCKTYSDSGHKFGGAR